MVAAAAAALSGAGSGTTGGSSAAVAAAAAGNGGSVFSPMTSQLPAVRAGSLGAHTAAVGAGDAAGHVSVQYLLAHAPSLPFFHPYNTH
jgi:hypothetical protein